MENTLMSDKFKVGDRVILTLKVSKGVPNPLEAHTQGTVMQAAQITTSGKKYYTVLTKAGTIVPGFEDRLLLDDVENSKLWKVLA